jgi:hypothetical protein
MTLVELLVSLAIVMLIIGAATTAYLKLLRTYRTQGRLAESYMANLTGLEMLRYDIEAAGFGLPASLAAGATYSEAVSISPALPYGSPTLLNDASSNAPRPFVHLDNLGAGNSDVLSIKSTAANVFNNPAGKKWSVISTAANYQQQTNTNPKVRLWGVTALDPVMDFTTNDVFIVLDGTGTLQPNQAGAWTGYYTFNASAPNTGYYNNAAGASPIPNPGLSGQQVYYAYGLDSNVGTHRMPFNRVDYFLNKIAADFPSSCDPNTYTLYRSVIDQATGQQLSQTPLLDCVRDFQVAFGIDPSGLGTQPIQWQSNLLQNAIPGGVNGAQMTAAQMQQYLREVRVFVLFQEGLGDTSRSASFRWSGILNLGDQDIAHGLDPGDYPVPPNNFQQLSSAALPGHPQLSSFQPTTATDLQYRWKIIEMDAKPMNLLNLTPGTAR